MSLENINRMARELKAAGWTLITEDGPDGATAVVTLEDETKRFTATSVLRAVEAAHWMATLRLMRAPGTSQTKMERLRDAALNMYRPAPKSKPRGTHFRWDNDRHKYVETAA